MDPALTSFVPHGLALFIGGLLASLGPGQWARRPRGTTLLTELANDRWWATVCLMTVLPGYIAWMTVRSFVAPGAAGLQLAIWKMLLLGIAIGIPMSIPALVATRRTGRQRKAAVDRWAHRSPEESDRRDFARDLAEMMGDLTPDSATRTARATGTEGRVLTLIGEVDPKGGEMLTEALREDLAAIGFERVEGTSAGRSWWTRV